MFIPPVITVFISIVVGIVLLTPTAFSQSIPKPLIDTELVEAEEPQEEEHPLEQARHAYNFHDDATTIQILGAFIDTTSDVDQLIEAYSLLSDAFTRRGEYQKAVAQLELQLSLHHPIDTIGIHTTLQGIADLYEQQGDFLAMVDTVLREHELARTEDREKLVEQINTMLQMQLTRDELRVLVDRYPTTFPGDAALAYLIQRYDQAGENEFFTMEQLVNRLVKQFPEHEYASFASARLSALRSQLLQHRHVIGVLLPLSGNLSSYAKDILNGIRLAVDQNQMARSIGFVVIDIAQDDHTLIDHVNQLWHNFTPIALIGPLLSKNLGALTEWSEKFEVPVLSPTATKPDIAQRGSFLFSTAITEELLGNALARYAMLELGMTQFAILAPNDPYGSELSDAFSAAIAQMEGDGLWIVYSNHPNRRPQT
jgi:outer membrane PBP1 activator LpoA protein